MNTPLTPEEIYNNVSTELTGSVPGIGINTLVKRCMEQYVDQQTAALREELEKQRNNWRKLHDIAINELEAVKKERDQLKTDLDFASRTQAESEKMRLAAYENSLALNAQRDDAVKLIERAVNMLFALMQFGPKEEICKEVSDFINDDILKFKQHLSSRETNPSEIPNSSNPEITDAEFEKCPICHIGDWTVVIDDFGNRTNKCFECGVETLPAPPESLTDKNDDRE